MARSPVRSLALPLLLSAAAAAWAQQPPPPAEPTPEITVQGQAELDRAPLAGPAVFLSPMGEPFRSEDKLSGAEHWFQEADVGGSGRLTREEFLNDAMRFFAKIDTDHDGVIGPDELLHYETVVAPEVMVASTYGDASKATVDDDGKVTDPPYPTRLGAGRYGYLAAPEPIATADANLDRGVTRAEFEAAAAKRFKQLDRNGDGAIVRSELPRLGSPRSTGG